MEKKSEELLAFSVRVFTLQEEEEERMETPGEVTVEAAGGTPMDTDGVQGSKTRLGFRV